MAKTNPMCLQCYYPVINCKCINKSMNEEQKQLIREKFEKEFSDLMHPNLMYLPLEGTPTWFKGGYTETVIDFWLNEIDSAIKQTEERIVEGIEKIQTANIDNGFGRLNPLDSLITLIRNK